MHIQLGGIDYAILLIYFAFVIGIGWVLKRYMKGSTDFFLSGRSIPAWVTGLAFLSANLGAQEVIGMAASGAKYGIMTSHFYWLGAIPAMVFLAIFMMPFYYGSRARSVPEYLKLRFDEKTRGFNAVSFAVMTVFSSGISLHALAKLLETLMGWNYFACIGISAFIVLVYIFLGGLTSAIYNEVLQFFMIVLGFAPLVFLALKDVGGWAALQAEADPGGHQPELRPRHLDGFVEAHGQRAGEPDGRRLVRHDDGAGVRAVIRLLVHGLPGSAAGDGGQLDVRRAAHTADRRDPQDAVPGAGHPAGHDCHSPPLLQRQPVPADRQGRHARLQHDHPHACWRSISRPGCWASASPRLMASFMSGMAGNVTAFNTVWTYDIYQSYIAPKKSDNHYLWMGRWATVFGILVSIGCAYLASKFNNIMDMLQLVFGFVNAPLFATFLLGMFWRRSTGHGAFFGAAGRHGSRRALPWAGTTRGRRSDAPGHQEAAGSPKISFHSEMGQNFWMAIVAWTSCFVLTIVISLATKRTKTNEELKGLVYSLTPKPETAHEPWYMQPMTVGILVLLATLS